ncbi:MAG TPA: cytochrome c, partial [Bryobacteraceae bacterium]|nr:cytochrome c [Bryobacteraceae bacterium]
MRISRFGLIIVILRSLSLAQDADPGRVLFEKTCARCHGADGNGGELGPAIGRRLAQRNDQELASLIREGLPQQGMPPNQVADAEMGPLTRFLRTLQRRPARPVVRLKIQTTGGKTLDGQALNQ